MFTYACQCVRVATIAAILCAPVRAELAVTIPCTVDHILDGDTLNVTALGIVVTVRLSHWSAELYEQGGTEARAELSKLCPRGSEATLAIPLPRPRRDGRRYLCDCFTFGRVLGRVEVQGRDVSRTMIDRGYATKNKPAHQEQP